MKSSQELRRSRYLGARETNVPEALVARGAPELERGRARKILAEIALLDPLTLSITTVARKVLDPDQTELSFSASRRSTVDKEGPYHPAVRSRVTQGFYAESAYPKMGDVKVSAWYRMGLDSQDEGSPTNLKLTNLGITVLGDRSKENEYYAIPFIDGDVDIVAIDSWPARVKEEMAALVKDVE